MGNELNPVIDAKTNNIVEIKSNQLNSSDSIDESENSNDSTVKIKEDNNNQNIKNVSNSYALLSTNNNCNSDNNVISNKKSNKKKKNKKNGFKKKDIQRNKINYFNNIYKKESIIGICLNLFFWIWTILLLLDYNQIIKFPRASLGKKIDMIYTGFNSDSFWGGFFSTLICTIFNYFFIFKYPEIIFFLSYIIYVVYSVCIIPNDKFKENSCFLSHGMYKLLVFLTLGEIYKICARNYLDI